MCEKMGGIGSVIIPSFTSGTLSDIENGFLCSVYERACSTFGNCIENIFLCMARCSIERVSTLCLYAMNYLLLLQ